MSGLLATVEAFGHEVVFTPSLFETSLPLAGQLGHQGGVPLRLRPPLLGRTYEDFAWPMALHPSVEWFPDVLLHVVLRLVTYAVLARWSWSDSLSARAPLLFRPWLTRWLSLV